jgi:hypothetical protein
MGLYRDVIVAGFILSMMVPLKGQTRIGGVIDFHIAGINVQPDITSEEYSSYLGFGIGAVVDRMITETIDLHLEPMILQKWGKISPGE